MCCVFAFFSQREFGLFSKPWSAFFCQGCWQAVGASPRLFEEVLSLLWKNFWRLLFGDLLDFCWQDFDNGSTIFGGVLNIFPLVGKVWQPVPLSRRPRRRPSRGRSSLGEDRPCFAFHEGRCPARRRHRPSSPAPSPFGANNRKRSVAGWPQRRRGDRRHFMEAAPIWRPARAKRSCSARGRSLRPRPAQ